MAEVHGGRKVQRPSPQQPATRKNLGHNHFGVHSVDPFSSPNKLLPSLTKALLATAFFRCWHILIFFGAWSTGIALINAHVTNLTIQPTLLTVFGTVLGFVISYRTTSSFERYNEGRKYWSQIVHASRNMARAVWFHVPEEVPQTSEDKAIGRTESECRARVLVEKKTVINLVEAFAVAVKHYLRGEEGIFYEDLYHLVKYLPTYTLPAGYPADIRKHSVEASGREGNGQDEATLTRNTTRGKTGAGADGGAEPGSNSDADLEKGQQIEVPSVPVMASPRRTAFFSPAMRMGFSSSTAASHAGAPGESNLFPARMPPKYHLFDIFPFSLLVKALTKSGKELKGKKAARYRARMLNQLAGNISHNVPLEISLYLTSYVSALANRKSIDVPTVNLMITSITQLTDALTGLERILTTPIPFSYSVHLWLVTALYCLALPFQLLQPLKWLSIPATVLGSFIFFGFLVAGEEIENPFGYDKNDLNLDHFTQNIVRNELLAVTSRPPPNPSDWAFSPLNDRVMTAGAPSAPQSKYEDPKVDDMDGHDEVMIPSEWVARGVDEMQTVLAHAQDHMHIVAAKKKRS